MKHYPYIISVLFAMLLSFSFACKTGHKSSKGEKSEISPFHLLAKKELGDKFTVEFNETGKFALCKSEFLPDPSVSHYTVKYFVYDIDREEIIFQEVIPRGEVEWYNGLKIKVSSVPGIIMPDAEVISNTYIYDIVSGKKTTLGSTEKF